MSKEAVCRSLGRWSMVLGNRRYEGARIQLVTGSPCEVPRVGTLIFFSSARMASALGQGRECTLVAIEVLAEAFESANTEPSFGSPLALGSFREDSGISSQARTAKRVYWGWGDAGLAGVRRAFRRRAGRGDGPQFREMRRHRIVREELLEESIIALETSTGCGWSKRGWGRASKSSTGRIISGSREGRMELRSGLGWCGRDACSNRRVNDSWTSEASAEQAKLAVIEV
ncbi:hypothetical protein IW262DRAFT_1297599 [Armillaria fumosa]|nr:hypothetical protein IW262DRAFT_1297599 [Armillaria fumosa]